MFDFISASDLIVLGIAGALTATVIGLTQWWQGRKQRDLQAREEDRRPG